MSRAFITALTALQAASAWSDIEGTYNGLNGEEDRLSPKLAMKYRNEKVKFSPQELEKLSTLSGKEKRRYLKELKESYSSTPTGENEKWNYSQLQ